MQMRFWHPSRAISEIDTNQCFCNLRSIYDKQERQQPSEQQQQLRRQVAVMVEMALAAKPLVAATSTATPP